MPTYKAPVEDSLFLLNDVFHVERYNNLPGFAEATPEMVDAMLGEGGKFCEEVLAPLNRVGDIEGCTRHPDGSVTTPKGFKEAYRAMADGGWIGLSAEPGVRRPGPALRRRRRHERIRHLGQHGLRHVSGSVTGRRALALHRTAATSRRRPICRRWSAASGPAR